MFNAALNRLFGDEAWTDKTEESFADDVLSDLLPYRAYDAKTGLFHNEDTTGFVFEVSPVIGGSDIPGAVQAALSSQCPAGGTMQIINWASPDLEEPLNAWASVRNLRGELVSEMAVRRRAHFRDIRYGTDDLIKCIPHRRRVLVLGWVDGHAGLAQESELNEFRRALVSAFGGRETVRQIAAEAFVNFLAEVLHCQPIDNAAPIEYVPELALNYQLPGAGIRAERHGLGLMGDPQLSVSMASMRKTPREFRFALGHLLNGAPERLGDRPAGPLLTSLTARAMSSQAASGMMVKKRAAVQHTATTQFAKFAVNLQEKKDEIEGLHSEIESGERLFESIFAVGAYARGLPEEARLALTDVAKIYRYAGFQLENDMFIQLPLFLSSLPFGVSRKRMSDLAKLQRMRLWKGAAITSLLNVHGEFAGTPDPDAMLLVGRQGQLFFWDNYISGGNYNVSVVGKSGAGKSVFMQELVTSIFASGGRIVVIDDGYSFKNTCEILGGKWVGFDGSREIKLNPFSMLDPEAMQGEEYQRDAIQLVTRVIATMASLGGNQADRVQEIEEDMIASAVSEAWDKEAGAAEIRHVRDILAERAEDQDKLKYVVVKLDRFCPGGLYGDYFTGPANLALDENFTVFELSDIKGQKGLEAVVLQLIMFLGTELMYKTPRHERVAILIDEAWDLLQAPGTSNFIEGVVRRARKYTGALITGTQSVNDYYANDAAKVCFENSDWSVFLAQKPETIDGLAKDARLGVSPYVMEQLKSLQSVPGQFAEVGIKGASGWSFGRLVLDPFSLAIFSSKGSTVERLRRYRAEGHTMVEALRLMVERGEVS